MDDRTIWVTAAPPSPPRWRRRDRVGRIMLSGSFGVMAVIFAIGLIGPSLASVVVLFPAAVLTALTLSFLKK